MENNTRTRECHVLRDHRSSLRSHAPHIFRDVLRGGEWNCPGYTDAGHAIRSHLAPVLLGMLDRYTAEHFDGTELTPQHAEALAHPSEGQLEDFYYFMARQPEMVFMWEESGHKTCFVFDRPRIMEVDLETGEESDAEFS